MTTSKKVSFRAAALAASVLLLGVTACSSSDGGNGSNGGGGDNGSVEAVDDGTTLKMWTRAPLEAQAINAVEAYNASHENQIELEILPNDDVEGMVGSAAQTDSLPDILEIGRASCRERGHDPAQ